LLDPDSIIVAYDFKRGEPRGKLSARKEKRTLGDCIDCFQCVEVCPTGIDIRNGTQLECVNCTACIDACNHIMDKVKKPRGLIRYASFNGINLGQKLKLTPRIAGYTAVLIALVTVLVVLMLNRKSVEITVMRTPGALYQELDDGRLANLYNLKVLNKTLQEKPIHLALQSPQGSIELVGEKLMIPPGNIAETAFIIKLPRSELKTISTTVMIDVYSGDELLDQKKTSFIGPNPYMK